MNSSDPMENSINSTTSDLIYVGFWKRFGASLIDYMIVLCITLPILMFYYGESYWTNDDLLEGPFDFFLSFVFPAVATIWFWVAKQATPGKMAIHAKIIDTKTGMAPTTGQYIGRYFGYVLSTLPLGLGYIWIAFDPKNQGWHDKLAGTVVIAPKVVERKEVSFEGN